MLQSASRPFGSVLTCAMRRGLWANDAGLGDGRHLRGAARLHVLLHEAATPEYDLSTWLSRLGASATPMLGGVHLCGDDNTIERERARARGEGGAGFYYFGSNYMHKALAMLAIAGACGCVPEQASGSTVWWALSMQLQSPFLFHSDAPSALVSRDVCAYTHLISLDDDVLLPPSTLRQLVSSIVPSRPPSPRAASLLERPRTAFEEAGCGVLEPLLSSGIPTAEMFEVPCVGVSRWPRLIAEWMHG